jgi:threonine dehydratase
LAGKIPVRHQTLATVVRGGSIAVPLLNRIIEKGLVEEGRQLHLHTIIPDRPGQLSRLLARVASLKANVVRVNHERWDPSIAPQDVSIDLILETRDAAHWREIVDTLRDDGYRVTADTASAGNYHTKNFDN